MAEMTMQRRNHLCTYQIVQIVGIAKLYTVEILKSYFIAIQTYSIALCVGGTELQTDQQMDGQMDDPITRYLLEARGIKRPLQQM